MADEARVQAGLTIVKRSTDGSTALIDYNSRPTAFTADVTGSSGPYQGTLLVPVTGVAVDLTNVDEPGLARIMNQDSTNYVMLGIHDGTIFFPMMELLPGESYVMRLYRFLGTEFVGTGTPADVNNLWLQADGASCRVLVEVFPR